MVYQNGPKLLPSGPSRPLTRVMARARSSSGGAKRNSSPTGPGTPAQDAYRMEVNEYVTRPSSPSSKVPGPTIPCVTVRDLRNVVPDKKQRRVWVPVAICDELANVLKQAKQDGDKTGFDVSKLPLQVFQCPVTKKRVEIERVDDSTRLRSFMDSPSKENVNSAAGGDKVMEVIELRNELMGRLIRFLGDVATRYRPINTQMMVPSLYSYSGERRFYYDLRETRWGLRLHISQVTEMHRNVIGIPLEAVVAFRDRLNLAIEFLGLEEKGKPAGQNKKNRTKASSGSRKSRNNRRQGRKRESLTGGDKKPEDSDREGEAKPATNEDGSDRPEGSTAIAGNKPPKKAANKESKRKVNKEAEKNSDNNIGIVNDNNMGNASSGKGKDNAVEKETETNDAAESGSKVAEPAESSNEEEEEEEEEEESSETEEK